MSSLSCNLKTFLYRHSNIVDFLNASLIIVLCLLILLPKVHESFLITSSNDHDFTNFAQQLKLADLLKPTNDAHNHNHHYHMLPVGEIIICTGFFVFYCMGLYLSGSAKQSDQNERQPLLLAKRKVSPYYVEEITITRRPIEARDGSGNQADSDTFFEQSATLVWPSSIRVTTFALIVAAVLIVFDVNVHGLMEAIKVFRAAATGALLYVAFFLVLPKGPGCKVCTKVVGSQDDDLTTTGRRSIH